MHAFSFSIIMSFDFDLYFECTYFVFVYWIIGLKCFSIICFEFVVILTASETETETETTAPPSVTACPGNQVFGECVSSQCDKTCVTPNPPCTADCVNKCVCPDDTPLWHDGMCIAQEQCPGYYTNIY